MMRLSAYVKTNKNSFFPEDPVIPSQVTDVMYLRYDPRIKNFEAGEDYFYTEEDSSSEEDLRSETPCKNESEEEQIYSGKWMLFYDISQINIARGMTAHDYAWQFVFSLVDNFKNSRVFGALCSTGYVGYYPKIPNSRDGVICLFTEDYRDKRDVKRAADSIRQVFSYPHDMHYKTDEATLSGLYKCYGHKYICNYKHKPDCSMLVRDELDPLVWRPVDFED